MFQEDSSASEHAVMGILEGSNHLCSWYSVLMEYPMESNLGSEECYSDYITNSVRDPFAEGGGVGARRRRGLEKLNSLEGSSSKR